jgi:hypothetical protein
MCESMDKNRVQGVSVGRVGNLPRSPYPSKTRNVDPAAVHKRRLSLPQEICSASRERLRLPEGDLTAGQKSAEGILAMTSVRLVRHSDAERRSQQIGRAGNGG